MVKEIEKLIDDKTLNNLIILWEKLENHKINHDNNQTKDSIYLSNNINNTQRHKQDIKLWTTPNSNKLHIPNQDHCSKIFSMTYNEDEKKNYTSVNVIIFHLNLMNEKN